jgi:putative two-component system response regulator
MTDMNGGYLGLFSRASAYLDRNTGDEESEDLEPLEVIELEEEVEVEALNKAEQHHFSIATNPYVNSFFPVVIIDRKMKILFANEACKNLFTGYVDFSGKYFADIFGKPFGIDDLRNIHNAVMEGQNSYFWKGEVRIKSRNVVSVQIKVFIFPVELEVENPNEFVVMFDDITEENNRLTRSTFLGLLEASKLKDRDTGSHIIRVNHYSKRLSEELFQSKNPKYNRIDADFIDNIGFLASMHDLGKIGTPDDILNKEGPLLDWEWKIMKEHTINGGIILSSYPNKMAQEIARCHHEHWDGSGYPYQLSEEQIPLAARIVTIADVYDALRTVRSYKPAYSHEMVIQKINEGKESHFDPFLVEVFNSVEKDFNRIYEENFDSI